MLLIAIVLGVAAGLAAGGRISNLLSVQIRYGALIIAGLLLMVIVLFVAPLLAYLPNAAMAGILFLVAFGIIDFGHIRKIVRASRSDSIRIDCRPPSGPWRQYGSHSPCGFTSIHRDTRRSCRSGSFS